MKSLRIASVPVLALVLPLVFGAAAQAATIPVHGVIRSQGGSVVPDGNYLLVAALYDKVDAPQPLWQELVKQVVVQYGAFTVDLGAATPIGDGLVTSGQPLWIGIQVGGDPELPRVPLKATPRAVYAQAAGSATFGYAKSDTPGGDATGLACTGCIAAGHIEPGAVTPEKVAFTYAGSDAKGGAATEALHALSADTAKAADTAASADKATSATSAATAGLAKALQCSGCVAAEMLAPDVAGAFVPIAGGAISGDLVVSGALTAGSLGVTTTATVKGTLGVTGAATLGSLSVTGGVRFGDVKDACGPSLAGVVRWTGKALQVCSGTDWRQLDNQPAPTITAVSPTIVTTGGGQTLTLTGANFSDTLIVTIGGVKASIVAVLSSTQMTVTAPVLPSAGPKDVAVTGSDGTQSVLVAGVQAELTGLVAYFDAARKDSWPGNGGTWFDLAGSGANASLVGGAAYGTLGAMPTMVFNGSGAGAQFPNAKLDTQKFTAIYWVYSQLTTSDTGQGGLYVNRTVVTANASDWVWFGKYAADTWYYRVNNGACCNDLGGSGGGSWSSAVPAGKWTMVHFAFQPGVTNGWKWGANGANVATGTLGGRPNSQTEGTSTIGYGHEGAGAYWKGGIASARFFNRLLSDTEIQAEFARMKAQYGL